MTQSTIIYVTPSLTCDTDLAIVFNTRQRIGILKSLGYNVINVPYSALHSVKGSLHLFRSLDRASHVIIRIDGSNVGGKYALLKILKPSLHVLWEVHGFSEENVLFRGGMSIKMRWMNYINRIYSRYVDTCFYISNELKAVGVTKFHAQHHVVVPNFVVHLDKKYTSQSKKVSTRLKKIITNKFVVLWGGSPRYRWQAIDVIGHLASYIGRKDQSILFIVVGKESWYPLKPTPNLLCVRALSRSNYRWLIRRADLCLALYHKPPNVPFYFFPMKILDYMYHGRPVIASDYPTIQSIITHGVNGYLVPNTIPVIANTILKLKRDSQLRRVLGTSARETVLRKYTDEVVRKQYRDLLRFDGLGKHRHNISGKM